LSARLLRASFHLVYAMRLPPPITPLLEIETRGGDICASVYSQKKRARIQKCRAESRMCRSWITIYGWADLRQFLARISESM
jgi:hypothetical protein